MLPNGSELTGQLKFIIADSLLDTNQPVELTDLALFELAGRHAFGGRYEITGAVDLLPKQPSDSDEKVWQSASGGVRVAFAHNVALAVGGAGGHLLDHDGEWLRQSAMLEWKHTLNEFVAFDIQGGADEIELEAPGASGANLTEVAVQTSSFFREPTGHWGAWLGVTYAVPVEHAGVDPTTEMAIDPQPRIDLDIGTVLAIVPEWDLFITAAIINRGDLANRATMLPILDGGFDQRQLVLGVTRHFAGSDKHSRRTVGEPLQM